MAANVGHNLSVENLSIRPRVDRAVLRGQCGELFNIKADDWPALRAAVNKAIRLSKKESKNPVMKDLLKDAPVGVPSLCNQ